MKKLLFLALFFYAFSGIASAQNHQDANHNGHGATSTEEIGQAVFTALQQNRFDNLQNYLPDDAELRQLKHQSSKDMRAMLQTLSPDSIKLNLQTQFARLSKESTENAFSWQEWALADTKSTQRDARNPGLHSVKIQIADATGNTNAIMFEAIKVRNRFFLFRQMVFQPKS